MCVASVDFKTKLCSFVPLSLSCKDSEIMWAFIYFPVFDLIAGINILESFEFLTLKMQMIELSNEFSAKNEHSSKVWDVLCTVKNQYYQRSQSTRSVH